ncbi:hypothetical protein O3M35_004135 [Rhynocoris fuscipes]|uniref:ODAD1 central coiled coil region domain-containing protein n=1 Tax=Rhynocoris fuscipes TaxID=488301 RepID=A0AAW1CJ23_9HEMI
MSSKKIKRNLTKKLDEDEPTTKGVKMTLIRLSKEFKAIEGSRLAITKIMRRQLAKQWSQLIQLRNEYKKISAAFNERKQLQNDKNYIKEVNHIIGLIKRQMELKEEEISKKQSILTLKEKLEQASKNFEQLQIRYNKIFLDKTTIELNKVVVVNSKLRQEVCYELRERAQFKRLYDYLLNEIVATTEIILDGTEDAALSLELRKEGMERNRFYGLCLKKRTLKHIAELRELRCEKNLIFRSSKFHNTKTKQRRQRLHVHDIAVAELNEIQQLQNTAKKYENLYNDILKNFGKNTMTIDEICEEFRSREDENFAIFSYINEVNHEGENINETIKILMKRMVLEIELKEEIVEKGNDYLDEIEKEFKLIQLQRNRLIEMRNHINNYTKIMIEGFEKLYSLIRGNLTSFSKTLVTTSKLDYSNLHFLLPVIHKQVYKIKKRINDNIFENETKINFGDKDFKPLKLRKKVLLKEIGINHEN